MFFKAFLAFLALPFVVAGIIPFLVFKFDPFKGYGDFKGIFLLLVGVVILFQCIKEFFVAGKGTLAPWDPPKKLVTTGLYSYSRNPMYIGVIILLIGWGWVTTSILILIYTVAVTILFHKRIIKYEEPWQEKTFGNIWIGYKKKVPRWFF